MPQNKNLTQISLSEGGFGGRNGVIDEREKGTCGRSLQAVRESRQERENGNPQRAGRVFGLQQEIPDSQTGGARENPDSSAGQQNRKA